MDKPCEVCSGTRLKSVLDLGMHPLCDDLVSVGEDRSCKEYPIRISFCKDCFTAHQICTVPKADLFPATYHYRSRMTGDVLAGMQDFVEYTEKFAGNLSGCKILDIGCNDGSLLSFFSSKKAITYGIEPTNAIDDADSTQHNLHKAFFDGPSTQLLLKEYGKFDIIVLTNVFAHIEDLPGLIANISLLMHDNSLLVIENHYLGSVLDRNQFDTFYHEHPRTYSLKSFEIIASRLQRSVLNACFPSRYGGNIRVVIGPEEKRNLTEWDSEVYSIYQREADFDKQFTSMNHFIDRWKQSKRTEILAACDEAGGPIEAKAFPGRAAILIKLLNLTENEISCVYEKPGSPKIGHFVPGTKIPIRSDELLFKHIQELPLILNLAWHISREIDSYLRGVGFKGKLLSIL